MTLNPSEKLLTHWFSKKALVFYILAILLTVISNLVYGPMLNNGDYGRIGFQIFVLPDSWKTSFTCMPFGDVKLAGWMPLSTGALYGSVVSVLSILFGLSCFSIEYYFLGLSFLYFWGLRQVQKEEIGGRSNNLIVITFFIFYGLFSYAFQSFYEEALILALAPWLLYTYDLLKQKKRYWPYAIVASLLIFCKTQMVFMLPIVLWPLMNQFIQLIWTSNKPYKKTMAYQLIGLIGLVLVSTSVSLNKNSIHGFSVMNAHDRFFNGIGWVLQGVTNWPGAEFNQRLTYFQANRPALEVLSLAYEPIPKVNLMGTSYWPHGWDLANSPIQKKLSATVMRRHYLNFFIRNPAFIPKMLMTVGVVTAISDYGITDIKAYRLNNPGALFISQGIRELFSFFGFIYILIGIIGMLVVKDFWQKIGFAYFIFGAPLFVVAGSGFAYFEQHMLPYFMLLPVAIGLTLMGFVSRKTQHNSPLGSYETKSIKGGNPATLSTSWRLPRFSAITWPMGLMGLMGLIGLIVFLALGLLTLQWLNRVQDLDRPITFAKGSSGVVFLDNSEAILGGGWSNPEAWGVWVAGSEAQLQLPLPKFPSPKSLRLELRAFVSANHPSQSLTLYVNDQRLKTIELIQGENNVIEIPLGTSMNFIEQWLSKRLRIDLQCNNPISPKMLGLGDDDRVLCVGLERATFIYE